MTELSSDPDQQEHAGPVERGRYALYRTPDDGVLIARASGICETCQECGCGEQQENFGPVSAVMLQAAQLAGQGRIPEAMKLLMANGIKLPGMGMLSRDKGPVRSGRR
jgi:hypothetical protein